MISLLLLFGFDSDSYGTFSSSEVSHLRQEPVIKLFNMDHGQCVYLVIIIPQGRTAFIMIVILRDIPFKVGFTKVKFNNEK